MLFGLPCLLLFRLAGLLACQLLIGWLLVAFFSLLARGLLFLPHVLEDFLEGVARLRFRVDRLAGLPGLCVAGFACS